MRRADMLIRALLDESAPGLAPRRSLVGVRSVDVGRVAATLRRHGYRPGALHPEKGIADTVGFIRPDGHEVEILSTTPNGPLEVRHWGPRSSNTVGATYVARSTDSAVRYLNKLHKGKKLPKASDWRRSPDAHNRLSKEGTQG